MKARILSGLLLGVAVAALGLPACPIGPDFSTTTDAGDDAGIQDAGVDDAGIDAGATGSMGATFTVSDMLNTSNLAWNGTDVSGSTLDSPSQVTLRGNNATSGSFLLQLENLTAGGTGELWTETTYSPASGSDIWTCNNVVGAGCTVQVTLLNFDGVNIAGTFAISYAPDAVGNSATLTSGSFSISLP